MALYMSKTEGLEERPVSLVPPKTVTDPLWPRGVLVEKEVVGPLPKEFVGDIPNIAPPDMEALSLNVPFEADSCRHWSADKEADPSVGLPRLPVVLSSKLVEELSMVESRAPPTLKNCAVSPRLSKD